jgi:two-component system cell cycle sensor histidine kinase/response regulator CckA
MPQPLAVLLVEDSEEPALSIERCLAKAGYDFRITRVDNERALRGELARGTFDVVLSDHDVRAFGSPDVAALLKETNKDIPLIALFGQVSEESILTMLAGAGDYVMKDNLTRLPSCIEREMREAEGRRQRKSLEAQLQQAVKMEAIGRLAAGVAHDFNNLLTVIAGFAQLAMMEDNPAREGLEQIMLAAERASGLSGQLLAISRQQALEPRIFDLNHLVLDMEKMLRRLIGENVEVITRVAPEPMTVKADRGQIEQVLLNLAVNSRDSMPKGGKLILSTYRQILNGASATMRSLPEGEYCTLSVSDSGGGIPPEVLPHIFEPFFTTKPEGRGTGLGLSTAYGIMQQSGGAIQACSDWGSGTTMTVLLPASSGMAEAVPAADAFLTSGTEKILVAEDDPVVLHLVSTSLSASGFRVFQASNGEDAIDLLHAQGPAGVDVLIADVVMTGMSGPALATRAAELLPGLKILFMSGYAEELIQTYGMPRSKVAFLQKPFAPSELVRKVRRLLDAKSVETLTTPVR